MGVLTKIVDGKLVNTEFDTDDDAVNAAINCFTIVAGERVDGKKDELQFVIDRLIESGNYKLATVVKDVRRDLQRAVDIIMGDV